jgi:hypothetical protein
MIIDSNGRHRAFERHTFADVRKDQIIGDR